jgi:hypothetical protein
MTHKLFKICLTLLFILIFINTHAQDVIDASGSVANGSGGSTSYSIGQITYKSDSGSGEIVTQGVQHAFELFVLDVSNTINLKYQIKIYPNPTVDNLIIKISDINLKNLTYYLYDVNGKLLKSQKINQNDTIISMKKFQTAIYFLNIFDTSKQIKSFKIIKK